MNNLTSDELEWLVHDNYVPPISSGFSEETLRKAIADAKEVRETAYRNAKEALRKAFESNGCIIETD